MLGPGPILTRGLSDRVVAGAYEMRGPECRVLPGVAGRLRRHYRDVPSRALARMCKYTVECAT
eukprot:6079726-Alexandrium_andersonii.AAC.1